MNSSEQHISILFVIDGLEFGGGERGFAQIIYGINRSQYKVHVACNPGGEFEARLRAMDIRLERVNMKSKFNLFTILKLIRILKEGRFRIIHTQGARADFFGRVAGRLARVPHIICTVAMPVEGFGIVVGEAMAMGKPVISTRTDGSEVLIKENETGIIVPLKDPLSLADAVLKLITDPPRMKKMGELGKERVRRYFTPEKFISEHEDFYREILH